MSSNVTLQETLLYQKLKELSEEDVISREKANRLKALNLVNEICDEAAEGMKAVIKLFNEYTLHDEIHLVNVTHIMGILLQEAESIDNLNYIEITLLILSAYLHDIGMAFPKDKLDEIVDSNEFKQFRETRKDELEGLKEFENILNTASDEQKPGLRLQIAEIEQSILTDYIRGLHGDLGAEYIVQKWKNDGRWELENYNIAQIVSLICKGHSLHSDQLISEYKNDYPLDKIVGNTKVNIIYCTLILRLADILDFDRERTPDILYENISPRNEISVNEWNKHKSVVGWEISKDRIIFECECTHPVYEKTLRQFLDYMDSELQSCLLKIGDFPRRNKIAEHYGLKLPQSVDRSRISAKDNSYQYLDLEFSLSHEEIMQLLMGSELWGGTSLCIRELIQNAYDAIRHRRAKEKAAGNDWNDGKITLIQRLNAKGELEIVCKDNGIGMNKHVLENYFFKVGRSYYSSSEFEKERLGLKGKGADFDPISQFGIGVLSTFMIGESIKIRTQRYLGPHRGCEPSLDVEVTGISRMAVIRISDEDNFNPGTEIIITGEKLKSEDIFGDSNQMIDLLQATQYYAAALDIPINVIVESPFKPCNLTIDPVSRPLKLKTFFEENIPQKYIITLEKDFSIISNDYEGIMKISFLVDNDGKICIENEWGKWIKLKKDTYELVRSSDREIITNFNICRYVTAQDGIIVTNFDEKRSNLSVDGFCMMSGPGFQGSYFINVFGSKKLPLKPDRTPDDYSAHNEVNAWKNFRSDIDKLSLEIVDDIIKNDLCQNPGIFWKIFGLNRFSHDEFSKKTAYESIYLPYIKNNKLTWMTLKEMHNQGINYISFDSYPSKPYKNTVYIPMKDLDKKLKNLGYNFWYYDSFKKFILSIIRAVTVLHVHNQKVLYEINPFITPFNSLKETKHKKRVKFNLFKLVKPKDIFYYQTYEKDYLYIHNLTKGINYSHPLIKFLLNSKELDDNPYYWFKLGAEILIELVDNVNLFNKQHTEWDDQLINNIKLIKSYWKNFEWDSLPNDLKPPYKILYPLSGEEINVSMDFIENMVAELGLEDDLPTQELIDLA